VLGVPYQFAHIQLPLSKKMALVSLEIFVYHFICQFNYASVIVVLGQILIELIHAESFFHLHVQKILY